MVDKMLEEDPKMKIKVALANAISAKIAYRFTFVLHRYS